MLCWTSRKLQRLKLMVAVIILLNIAALDRAANATNFLQKNSGHNQSEQTHAKTSKNEKARLSDDEQNHGDEYIYDYNDDDVPPPKDNIVATGTKDNFFVESNVNHEFPIWHAPHPAPGSLWPSPRSVRYTDSLVQLDAHELHFALTKADNDVLRQAIARYRHTILNQKAVSTLPTHFDSAQLNRAAGRLLTQVQIVVETDGKAYPHLHMDESYEIKIAASGTATISANQTWGALRALETFSQLVLRAANDWLYVKTVHIQDAPRFAHRGVMIDTARHFVAKHTLLRNLDAMEMNKMNVFHWHMVDDSSFPFQSRVWPRLSARGAYDATHMVYTVHDVQQVVEYARVRGIRVVPEFDMPGHTHSWGRGYPQLLTPCSNKAQEQQSDNAKFLMLHTNKRTGKQSPPPPPPPPPRPQRKSNVELGPMNPANNFTFTFIGRLFEELLQLFPDDYFHLGSDETGKSCWLSNADVRALLASEQKGEKVFEYFMDKTYETLERVAKKHNRDMKFMQWNDGLASGLLPPSGTIVQIWNSWHPNAEHCFSLGYQVIYNACWFLDDYKARVSWIPFYKCDSTFSNAAITGNQLFVGGEAVMWTEYVDDSNVLTKTWPLASTTAERLWSWSEADITEAAPRLEEQRCRMASRGIAVGVASGSGSCPRFSDRNPFVVEKVVENIEIFHQKPHNRTAKTVSYRQVDVPSLLYYILAIVTFAILAFFIDQFKIFGSHNHLRHNRRYISARQKLNRASLLTRT